MKINFYGCMLALSFILNFIFIFYLFKNTKIKLYEKLCIMLFEGWGFVVGGKLYTYFSNISEYKNYNFFSIGFSSLGAAIGGMIFLGIYALIFRKNIKFIYEKTLVTFPLMYSIGKIGCFVSGCCYGIKYSGLGAITYNSSVVAPNGVSLFPIQIVESIFFLLIFTYMIYLHKKNKVNILVLLLLCGITKFILDFLRNSHVGVFLSLNQIVSLIFIVISVILLFKNKKESVCL